MPRSIILGIDPGYGRMGFGCILVDRGSTKVLDYGIVTTSKDLEHSQRLLQISDDLTELIKSHKPTLLALEKIFFSKSVTTAMKVAEVRGVILLAAARAKIPVVEFSPPQVKAAITGNGRADKKGMTMMVSQILAMKRAPKVDDAADALALALCAVGSIPPRR